MPQHDWTVRAHVIDVLISIDVPDVRGLRRAQKNDGVRAPSQKQRRLMPIIPPGITFFARLHERIAMLKGIGFSRQLLFLNANALRVRQSSRSE